VCLLQSFLAGRDCKWTSFSAVHKVVFNFEITSLHCFCFAFKLHCLFIINDFCSSLVLAQLLYWIEAAFCVFCRIYLEH